MATRSILLGLLGSTFLLGCFEDPPPLVPSDDSSGSTAGEPTSTTDRPTSTSSNPDTGSSTGVGGTTTIDPTTAGPLDTTADSTTSELTATDGTTTTGPGDPCDLACMDLACGMQMGCDCGMCSAEATCSMDQSYCALPIGFYNAFGFETTIPTNLQIGFRFQVFQPRTVRRLGMLAWGAGVPVQMALYDHDGLGPANRLAQTGEVMLFAIGANEWDVGATNIMPGDYWVMLHTGGDVPVRRTLNGDNGYEEALRSPVPFGDGFPAVMNDESVIQDYRYNVYMVVED